MNGECDMEDFFKEMDELREQSEETEEVTEQGDHPRVGYKEIPEGSDRRNPEY